MPYNKLHNLLWNNPNDIDQVRALIGKYPNAVKEKNDNGHLPLHYAVRYGASVEVIQLLIEAYPDALKEKNNDGLLPLHSAFYNGASVEVIQLLIDEYPDAVKEKDGAGWLPLHVAVAKGVSVEVIQLLIKEYPDAVKEKDNDGLLPLHVAAVENDASVEVIQLLIDEYPDAVKEKNNGGLMPLHYAAKEGASVEVIKLLIDEYPDAVKEKDNDGLLPLHYAAAKGVSVEVIQLLIKEYPDAVKEKDNDGWLPLHYAVEFGTPVEVIQLLIKEYPDAVKVEDGDGVLPIDRPQIKEIYDSVKTVVQNLTRSQGLRGDHAEGEDLLGVKEEAQAIADTIAFKDLQPPFVVGILGGWGSGKSFTFNLLEEHLKEIQKYNLASEIIELNSPYVGHIYLIKFDVWTFAKGCLWSSLMYRILTELNNQLDLEAAIGSDLLMKGVSVIELMDQFTTGGEMKYLKEAMKDGSVKKEISEWKPRNGNITKALIDALNSNYKEEVEELAEKKQQLDNLTCEFEKQKDKKKQKLAWDDVTAGKSTKILPEIKRLIYDAYTQYAEENPGDTVPQTVETAMNNLERWKGLIGQFLRWWDLLWAGRLSPLWFVVFLFSLILAVVLPLILDKVGAIATAIGPLVSAIVLKFNDARAKLTSAQDVIVEIASEINLDKEQLQEAMEAANKAQLRSDTNDEENQQDIMKVLNAEINTLEDRVWLREGDSLNKVVRDRLGSSNYEDHLGVVHQAQADLKLISDAMLRRDGNEEDAAKKIFPRGNPRIILFIDDLDRCTPKKVVETLEAVQLLVKTKLFVVVLAIDAQYVTLCLEKEYEDILRPERHPSGLDYVEKIIQLPYRVPPIGDEYMESYLQEQMNAEEEEGIRGLSTDDEVRVTQEGSSSSDDDNQSPGQPNAEAPTPTAPTPTVGQTNSELLEAQMNAEDDDSREVSAHNVSPLKQEEEVEENLNANKNTHELFSGSEFLVEREESSAEGSDESKSPEPNNGDNQSPGQPNVKKPISHEVMASGTTNTTIVDLPEETLVNVTAQSESKEPMVSIPTKELKFTRKELQSLKDACVFSGVGPRSTRRLVNVFKLMKIIWYRRDQTPGVDTPHEVSMKDTCVLMLALCASNSKSVRQEMCKILAKIEQTTSMPADCYNLKDFIKIALRGVDCTRLTKINSEKCNGTFEKVRWKDYKEWNLVKNDLRLLRSFSFVGEFNELVDDIRDELNA